MDFDGQGGRGVGEGGGTKLLLEVRAIGRKQKEAWEMKA